MSSGTNVPAKRTRKRLNSVRHSNIWSTREDEIILEYGTTHTFEKNWNDISPQIPNKTVYQISNRWSTVLDPSLKHGSWEAAEEQLLKDLVQQYGTKSWSFIASKLTGRTGKQCRERWHFFLNPDLRFDQFTPEEDKIILNLHSLIGNNWTAIASAIPGRTSNSIKNRYNSLLSRSYPNTNNFCENISSQPTVEKPSESSLEPFPNFQIDSIVLNIYDDAP